MAVIRLLVCGGRHYADRARVYAVLDAVNRKHAIEALIHGACPRDKNGASADMLADDWARECRVPCEPVPVDHALDGPWPGAGPCRNERMRVTKRPTHAVSFPGENGTADMVRRLRASGIEPWVIS